VVSQLFYLLNCRNLYNFTAGRDFFSNKVVFLAMGALALLQAGFVYAPFMNSWFGTEPVNGYYWMWALAAGLTVFLLVELEKFYFKNRIAVNG